MLRSTDLVEIENYKRLNQINGIMLEIGQS